MVPAIDEYAIPKGRKIHSICKNYKFWEKRIKKIIAGEGFLSINIWTMSRRPKHTGISELHIEDADIGIEKLIRKKEGNKDNYYIESENGFIQIDTFTLAMNEYLLPEEFQDKYKNYPYGELALIHFTGFRYGTKIEGGRL